VISNKFIAAVLAAVLLAAMALGSATPIAGADTSLPAAGAPAAAPDMTLVIEYPDNYHYCNHRDGG